MNQKVVQYLNAGVRLLWLVYPDEKLVEVWTPDRTGRLLKPEDELNGGEVFPGFTCRVTDLFE